MRFAIGFAVVGVVIFTTFRAAEWHKDDVALPRFCDDPATHVTLLGRILTEPQPAGAEARRPYIIAAKLLYLVPRREEEAVEAYLSRVRDSIEETCP